MKKLTRDRRGGDDARRGGVRNRMELRAMSKPDKFHGSTVAIFAFACAVFVVAMVIANGAAVLQQHLNPNPDPFYYLVIFTIWASISIGPLQAVAAAASRRSTSSKARRRRIPAALSLTLLPTFFWPRGGGWTWFWRIASPTASNGCACSAALFTCSPS